MEVRTFFTSRQWTEVRREYNSWTEFLESGQSKQIGPDSDFGRYKEAAMYAYLVGDHARAATFLHTAVAVGFPPAYNSAIEDDHDRQWENYQAGVSTLRVGLAAQILGLTKRRDEILAWTVERLLDTEHFTGDEDPQYTRITLYRAYALLAAGRFCPKTEADLSLAVRHIREATDFPFEWSLPKALTDLVQCQKGNVTRQQATNALVQLTLDAKRDLFDRVQACFHVLYLQSAFPDVFDPALPPFPSHA